MFCPCTEKALDCDARHLSLFPLPPKFAKRLHHFSEKMHHKGCYYSLGMLKSQNILSWKGATKIIRVQFPAQDAHKNTNFTTQNLKSMAAAGLSSQLPGVCAQVSLFVSWALQQVLNSDSIMESTSSPRTQVEGLAAAVRSCRLGITRASEACFAQLSCRSYLCWQEAAAGPLLHQQARASPTPLSDQREAMKFHFCIFVFPILDLFSRMYGHTGSPTLVTWVTKSLNQQFLL